MKFGLLISIFCLSSIIMDAQMDSLLLAQENELNKRSKIVLYSTISAYSVGATSLYFAWYREFDQRSFHFFNDWHEWEQVDKLGHAYSSYTQTYLLHNAFKWSGQSDKQSLNNAAWIALGFQTAIEVMDGFSSEWGFSVPDMAFNVIGTGSYVLQEKLWQEQKLKFKFSYWPVSYPDEDLFFENALFISTASERADDLFGSNGIERILKDYNGQTIWLSFDLDRIFPNWKGPKWLDLALGYGAKNMYGGFSNAWVHNGIPVYMDKNQFPRTRQFYLALDYDLTTIKAKSSFLRTLLGGLDVFKWPAPAIEYSTDGEWSFHLLYPLHF